MRIKENENTFRILFEQSTDAMMLLDGDVFFDCNPAAVEMFDCSDKKQLLSLHPSDLCPEKQPDGSLSCEEEKKRIAKAIEQCSNRFEWLHQRINGEVFPVDGRRKYTEEIASEGLNPEMIKYAEESFQIEKAVKSKRVFIYESLPGEDFTDKAATLQPWVSKVRPPRPTWVR